MKLFSSLTLAGLALAAMPAFAASSVQIYEYANTYSTGEMYNVQSDGLGVANWSDPHYNFTVSATSTDLGNGSYEFKGSINEYLIYSQGVVNPFLNTIIETRLGMTLSPDGYTEVGTETLENSDGINNGTKYVNDVVKGWATQAGPGEPAEILTIDLGRIQYGVGYQYEIFDLVYTPIDAPTTDPTATPEPSTWAMIMFPLLGLVGFKVRSRFTLQ